MGSLLSTNRLTTVALTMVALAIAYRVPAVKNALTGDEKFLGIF